MRPVQEGLGAAMSSSPWERLWNGDGDVATPVKVGALSDCGLRAPGTSGWLGGVG
jgi:hypothetical protein